MDRDFEILASIGSEVSAAGEENKQSIRDSLVSAARGDKPRVRRRGFFGKRSLAVIAAALVVPAAVAVAAGLSSDVADSLHGFISGTEETHPIGRPVEPSDNPPDWWAHDGFTEQRVLASQGNHHLFAGRDEKGHVSFALDSTVGVVSGGVANPFLDDFQGQSVVPLFAAPARGPETLLISGLVAGDVARVELRYDTGDPDVEIVSGSGFIFAPDLGRVEQSEGSLIVDRWPTEIVAFDSSGEELQTVPAMCASGSPLLRLRSDPDAYYFAGCDEEGRNKSG